MLEELGIGIGIPVQCQSKSIDRKPRIHRLTLLAHGHFSTVTLGIWRICASIRGVENI
jgi:hypothetical protein